MPDFLVGKTAEEAATIAQQLYQAMVRGDTVPAPQAAQQMPQPQPWQQPPAAGPQAPTQEEWDMNPQAAAQKYIDYVQKTQFQPEMQRRDVALGQTARALMAQKYADEFKRWGPEIDLMLQTVDPAYRTVDTVEQAVKIVRANHIDEIAEERARAAMERQLESGTLLRPGTQPTGTPAPSGIDLKSAELPDNYARVLQRYRIDEATLDEFLSGPAGREYGATLDERRKNWLEQAKAGDVITEEAFNIHG